MLARLSLRAQIATLLAVSLILLTLLDVTAAVLVMRKAALIAGAASSGTDAGLLPRSAGGLLLAYSLLNALVVLPIALLLFTRTVIRPVDRLCEDAERVGRLEFSDVLANRPPALGTLGASFRRMAESLQTERARVAAQIDELRSLNQQLREAKDSLARSEKLATVGRLAAGVAHEIGNPLGAILGYLDLAAPKAGPEVRPLLSGIDREVSRIDRTVRELLAFARPDGPGSALSAVPLRDAVQSAVSLASVQKRMRDVTFEMEVAPEVRVVADAHRLSQVLVNILLNAGDAMKTGGRIRLVAQACQPPHPNRRASDPPPGSWVELSISDSGPGIRAEDLPKIFDPFFTTKEPGEGTGLGLSVCHRIMESFGGEIRASNQPEGGAVFRLLFREAGDGRLPEKTDIEG